MKLTYLLLIVLLAAISQSCKKILDVTPVGQALADNFYKTESDAALAVTAAYSPLRETISVENFIKAQTNDLIWGDIGTDDILKGGGNISDGAGLVQKEQYQITPDNLHLAAKWKINYKGIAFCNIVLAKIPSINFPASTANLKDRYLAEALFLRAYYYFDLVRYFGDVPLIDRMLDGNYNLPRAPKAEVYRLIETDLQQAIDELPSRFTYGATDIGRADKGAALGLMIRVCAFQGKKDLVKKYAEELFAINFNGKSYSLTANFPDIFQQAGEWNDESIFEITAATFSNGLSPSQIVSLNAPRSNGGTGFSQIKDDLRNEFEPNDPRYAASFYNVNGNYGTNWYNRKYSISPNSSYPGPLTTASNNLRIIRLSDIYLLYAESLYSTDPLTAISYVNKVRTRARGSQSANVLANISNTLRSEDLLKAIYHERRVELAGEGHRFFDLVRTSRAADKLSPLGFREGISEIMPIPASEIALSNGVLTQNKGY